MSDLDAPREHRMAGLFAWALAPGARAAAVAVAGLFTGGLIGLEFLLPREARGPALEGEPAYYAAFGALVAGLAALIGGVTRRWLGRSGGLTADAEDRTEP